MRSTIILAAAGIVSASVARRDYYAPPADVSTTAAAMTTMATYAMPPSSTTGYPMPPSGGDECATKCVAAYDACRGKADANQSTCAAELAACVNYNPFNGEGSFVTPTACSAASTGAYPPPAATTTGAYPPPGMTTAYPPPAGATTTASPSSPAAGGDMCAKECYTKYNECRGKMGSNKAACAAEFSGCLGYSPFDNSGSLVTPTACSGAVPTAIGGAGNSGYPMPTGAMSTGGSGYTPPTGTGVSPPVVTAGAATFKAGSALVVLGAVLLL